MIRTRQNGIEAALRLRVAELEAGLRHIAEHDVIIDVRRETVLGKPAERERGRWGKYAQEVLNVGKG